MRSGIAFAAALALCGSAFAASAPQHGFVASAKQEAHQIGWPRMHAKLAAIDPSAATRIQPNDAQRIQRALEVHRITGRTLTELHAASPPVEGNFIAYAWVPTDREKLYGNIEKRFHKMMSDGFLAEVAALHSRNDLHPDLPSIRSVGYRQLWEHLSGQVLLETAVQNAIFATRHLARRQLIWLRAEREVHWVDALESSARAQIERAMTECAQR